MRALKLFFVIVVSTAFVYSFSHLGATTYEAFLKQNDTFSQGTKIGSVDVSGSSRLEAESKVIDSLNNWQGNTKVILQYKEKKATLDILQLFSFAIGDSIANAVSGQQTPLRVTINEESYYSMLSSLATEPFLTMVEHNRLQKDLLMIASTLQKGEFAFNLFNYVSVNEKPSPAIVSESAFTDFYNLSELTKWTEKFNQLTIPPQGRFSMLNLLEDNGGYTFSAATLSVIATTLYKVILPTNFEIIERHISQKLPSYSELGYEAKIALNKMDLAFYNPNATEYTINFNRIENGLYVSLTGLPFVYEYNVQLKDRETFEPKTILQYDATVESGDIVIQEDGKPGTLVKVIRETIDENGVVIKSDQISEDFYAPIHRIEVHSLQTRKGSGGPTQVPLDETSKDTSNNDSEQETGTKDDEIWGAPNEPVKGNE